MAYRQYTKCASRQDFDKFYNGEIMGMLIGLGLGVGASAGLFLLFGLALLPGAALPAIGLLIGYCRWWLYYRLICLGGDVCAVGMVLTVARPEDKSGLDAFDTDYSFSLVLPPHHLGATLKDVEGDGVLGDLIAQKKPPTDGLKFNGNPERQWGNDPPTVTLHCEFEGGGVYDLLQAALAALAIATVATVLCGLAIIGWIACLLLTVAAGAVLLGGAVVALNDKGNPNDVNANLGEIHVNDPTRRGADLLVVKGTWVYDSAHEGWNEIHPIKHCQRVGTWEGSWSGAGFAPGHEKGLVEFWCDAIGTASSPLTIANQGKPENQWTVHPSVDGCTPKAGPSPEGPVIH